MPKGEITGYVDVAQLVLYAFWIFFAGLIFYLRREDRREGYPLESEASRGRAMPPDPFLIPSPKRFLLSNGHEKFAPQLGERTAWNFRGHKHEVWPGAPWSPRRTDCTMPSAPAPTPIARTATTRPGTARSASCPAGRRSLRRP